MNRLIVVLESAPLETVKVSSGGGGGKKRDRSGNPLGDGSAQSYQLLNCDDHHALLKKNNRDVADLRPDIAHQVSYFYFTIYIPIYYIYIPIYYIYIYRIIFDLIYIKGSTII